MKPQIRGDYYKPKDNPLKKINRIDQPFSRLIKLKREKTQLPISEMRKGYHYQVYSHMRITSQSIREHYEKSFANKLYNLDEIDTFLKRYKLTKMAQANTRNLSIPISSKENKY